MQLIIEDVYEHLGREPWVYCYEHGLTSPRGASQILEVGTITDDAEVIACAACEKALSREMVNA